ncbi:MAG: XdhC family protein [Chloroflexi bacterium]|nr:XdhC family protein [Chloroflexota bacterium]
MQIVFKEAVALLEQGQPFVMAWVVRTRGSTPQKPGAMLLVRRNGSIVGTLGGGCVEAEVWARCRDLMERGGGPTFSAFHLSDDLAAQSGMVCGGSMDIFVDPAAARPDFLPIAREVVRAYEGQGSVALATALSGPSLGAYLLLREDGARTGTLGSAELDALAVESAQAHIHRGTVELLADEDGTEVFVEGFTCPPTVIVAGGGHIALALYELGQLLGFRFIIIDDRPQFASRERFPQALDLIVGDYAEAFRNTPITPGAYIVIATRGHKHDDDALREAVRSPARYVGLVGSQRKVILIYRQLLGEGIPAERLRRVHAPVGLRIGARTPHEIALSILAEMVTERYGGDGQPMKLPERLLLRAGELAVRSPSTSSGQAPAAEESPLLATTPPSSSSTP